MTDRIYLSAPDVGVREEQAVVRAIRSGWAAPLGPEVDAFESEIAARVGRQYGVATNSGTAALHLALLGVGVRPGDIVITSTLTFVATANAIIYCGAEPYFIDVDPQTGNMDADLLEKALVSAAQKSQRVGAVVPVDLLGKAADYTKLVPIAERFGVPLVSDAAESLGADHRGRPAGSFGQAAVLSFNGNKIMTTSGGGMLVTDDKELADRSRYLATQARQPAVHYEHSDIGYNYRLSNVLAALGRAQLSRLDEMILRRRRIRALYSEVFADVVGVELFQTSGDEHDNCWLTAILVNTSVAGWSSSDLSQALAEQNIETRPLWKPMHLQPVFAESQSLLTGSSEDLFASGLTLPSGSSLSDRNLEVIETEIRRWLAERL